MLDGLFEGQVEETPDKAREAAQGGERTMPKKKPGVSSSTGIAESAFLASCGVGKLRKREVRSLRKTSRAVRWRRKRRGRAPATSNPVHFPFSVSKNARTAGGDPWYLPTNAP